MLPSNTLPWSFCRKIRQMVPKSKQTLNDRHSPSYFYYAFKPLSGAYMLGYYFPHLTASTGSAVYLPSHVNPMGFWWTSNPVIHTARIARIDRPSHTIMPSMACDLWGPRRVETVNDTVSQWRSNSVIRFVCLHGFFSIARRRRSEVAINEMAMPTKYCY